ncbi:MAG: two component transcriptional regulator, winged helix family [uncultured bacterium]|nr:MAG: two component transcriptional regulator, winged helix family [uncultured bacterium]OGH14004.1 MAG: hypothetical protein A2687_06075 [Candidatus Levybacteria bacterium RIFCSPHIGHO2_01_FULL_38_26]
MKTILVVEDNNDLQNYLKDLLLENGFGTRVSSTGSQALGIVKTSPPDLVILDLGLPDVSGESVCQTIVKEHPDIPIVILTARDGSEDVIKGLNLGADDYITKPFVGEELLARIKARLRPKGDEKITVADLILNSKSLEVKRGGKQIKLTPKEFRLLEYLMLNKGMVLSREMILNRIWSYSPDIETRVVDVYVGYLRKKIDGESSMKLIHSVRGFGYMLKD